MGLEAPFIAAVLRRRRKPGLRKVALESLAWGFGIAAVMLLTDQIFFDGASRVRLRQVGQEPMWYRVVAISYAALTEELLYRWLAMGLAVWAAWSVLKLFGRPSKRVAAWLGIAVAAFLFGLAHVGNVPDAPAPVARAVAVNGVAGLALGWRFWSRGLEAAIITHFVAGVFLYVVIAPWL